MGRSKYVGVKLIGNGCVDKSSLEKRFLGLLAVPKQTIARAFNFSTVYICAADVLAQGDVILPLNFCV